MTGVYDLILDRLGSGPLHMTLIDPDKQTPSRAGIMAAKAEEGGTDIILIGGTSGVDRDKMDGTARSIRETISLPIVIFPASSITLTSYADAILFMSLMNSRSVRYVNREAILGSLAIRDMGLEPIPTGYVVIEPGMLVGEVGDVHLLRRVDHEAAVSYALAAQNFGMAMFYLEGGSGVGTPIPEGMIKEVKRNIRIPLVVGGGVSRPEDARRIVAAGADIIVTGTMIESEDDLVRSVGRLKGSMIDGWKGRT